MNAINDNNNRKEDIKKDDVEIDDVNHSYIGDEYKDLINNILKSRLKDRALSFTEFDNRKLDLTNIVKNYLEKKILMWMIDCLLSRNPLNVCQLLTRE